MDTPPETATESATHAPSKQNLDAAPPPPHGAHRCTRMPGARVTEGHGVRAGSTHRSRGAPHEVSPAAMDLPRSVWQHAAWTHPLPSPTAKGRAPRSGPSWLHRLTGALDVTRLEIHVPDLVTRWGEERLVRIISRRRLREFWEQHADAESPLQTWYAVLKANSYENPHQVRQDFGTASFLGGSRTVFNIGGNKYRLIVDMRYDLGRVYNREVLTHAEYDRRAQDGML